MIVAATPRNGCEQLVVVDEQLHQPVVRSSVVPSSS